MDWISKQRWYHLVYVVAVCACAGWTALVFFRDPGVDFHRSTVPGMVYGDAHKPFVQRALFPGLLRGAMALSPQALENAATAFAESGPGAKIFSALQWMPEHALLYIYAGSGSYVLFIAFVFAVRGLYRSLYGDRLWLGDIVSLVLVLALPIGFHYGSKIYDPMTLFLTCLALLLMVRERWAAYFVVFVLATINKETAIILAFAFGAYFWDSQNLKRVNYVAMIAAQFIILAACKLIINQIFASNVGPDLAPIRVFIGRNLRWLIADYSVETLVAWGALFILLLSHWKDKPLFARRALFMGVPLVGLSFFMGFFDELRGYYELYPLIAILIAHSVTLHMGLKPEPKRVRWESSPE